jgi:hypothetical protein
MSKIMKNLFFILTFIIFFILYLSFLLPSEALTCRNYNNHDLCIITIKRSAKKHWEYRASVSVDGVKRPVEIYNCRSRFKLTTDKAVIPFEKDEAGELICGFFQKT